ncbi:glycosyl transferase [Thalassotalea insulae]|uniref:Glycosyl transferase n=1 Tax=Thalassotalea insulae TaxID=2056778 RepID=A0ABQ6GPN6_9GAMM|nr:glycosyltransferase [Thalassotalea insulae]GLX77579.1 glycosyl transferase [Thalassotalea insulae]
MKNGRMDISIALATFNGEAYIRQQLLSIVEQNVKPDEIVVCDDNSADKTVEIVLSIAKKFKDINFIVRVNETNLGYSQNFSKALELCSGEIIFLADQDDVWYENKIEHIIRLFQNHQEKSLIIHDLMFCDGLLTQQGQTKLQRLKKVSNPMDTYVVGMATAVRRDFLQLCLPIPDFSFISHDAWLHHCAAIYNQKLILDEVLADYRRHENNATKEVSINSANKMGPLDYFYLKLDKRQQQLNLNKRKQFVSVLLQWLNQNNAEVIKNCILDEKYVLTEIAKLNDEIVHLNFRLFALKQNFLYKNLLIFSNYFHGRYKHFNGIKSAFKDIL